MHWPCISLITDFGVDSPFVGVMKAVILSRTPAARVIDLFHNVAAYQADEAGFWLSRSYAYLPAGSIHVAVVDPGVGSARRIVAARYQAHTFLAPDNGLLHQAFGGLAGVEYRALDLPRLVKALRLPSISNTFHGRDIFAPVAAELAAGRCRFEELGSALDDLVSSAIGCAVRIGNTVHGAIISIDRFGNLISNIDASASLDGNVPYLQCGQRRFAVKRTYADAGAGEFIALVNSFGVYEIAQVQGHAADALNIKRGDKVELHTEMRSKD